MVVILGYNLIAHETQFHGYRRATLPARTGVHRSMDAEMETASAKLGGEKVIHYSVSGEPQETVEHKLSGRQILEKAGFTPPEDYKLTSDPSGHEIGLDDEEPIHPGEAFTATFRGVTPTS